MKLNKKLLPIATFTGLTALSAVVPTTLTGCSKKFDYHFDSNMDVIFPTAPQAVPDAAHKDKGYNADEARDLYFEHIEQDPSIYVQDVIKTTSMFFSFPVGAGSITFKGSASANYKNITANSQTHTISGEINLVCNASVRLPKKIAREWGGYDVGVNLDKATFSFQNLELYCSWDRDGWALLSIIDPIQSAPQQNSVGKININLNGSFSFGPQFVGFSNYERSINAPLVVEEITIDAIPLYIFRFFSSVQPSYHMQNIPGIESKEVIYE